MEAESLKAMSQLLAPRKAQSKSELPIIRFTTKPYRSCNEHSAVALDLDGKKQSHKIEEIMEAFRGVQFLAYETFNSIASQRRWRVILPLKNTINDHQKTSLLQAISDHTTLDIDPVSIKNHELGFYAPGFKNRCPQVVVHQAPSYIDQQRYAIHAIQSSFEVSDKLKDTDHQLQLDLWDGEQFSVHRYEQVKELWCDPSVQRAIAVNVLKLDKSLVDSVDVSSECCSKTFKSPIAGHDDKHPSCVLLSAPGRPLLIKDHSEHVNGRTLWSLDDLAYYNSRVSAQPSIAQEAFELTGPERYVWRLRLMVEAGVVKSPAVTFDEYPMADSDSPAAKLWKSVCHLYYVRWSVESEFGCPAPLSIKFLSTWSGLSEFKVRKARNELLKTGYISIVDERSSGARTIQLCMPGTYRTKKHKSTLHQQSWGRLKHAKVKYDGSLSKPIKALQFALDNELIPNTIYGEYHLRWLVELYVGCGGEALDKGLPGEVVADFEHCLSISLSDEDRESLRKIIAADHLQSAA